MLNEQYVPIAGAIIAFAAFCQGFMGLGFGIIAVAGIGFIPWDIERSTVIINLVLIVVNCTVLYAGRKDFAINWKLVRVILIGEFIGVPIGYWYIFTFGNKPVFKIVLGVILIMFALSHFITPTIKKKLPMTFGLAAGVLGGFLSGGFTAAGPVLALFIYSQYKNVVDAKGTLQVVFMTATLWRLCNIFIVGNGITPQIVKLTCMSLPFIFIFASLGHIISHRISNKKFVEGIVFTFFGFAGILHII